MTTIDKIRAEIERQSKSIENATGDFAEGRRLEQRVILSFLDTLPDEPVTDCHDLEEAKEGYIRKARSTPGHEWMTRDIEDAFKAGAKWMKAKMMEGAVEGFIFQSEDYYPKELIARYEGDLKMGDKVKIIIVKEDGKCCL